MLIFFRLSAPGASCSPSWLTPFMTRTRCLWPWPSSSAYSPTSWAARWNANNSGGLDLYCESCDFSFITLSTVWGLCVPLRPGFMVASSWFLLCSGASPPRRRLLDKFPCAEVHDDRLLQKCEKLEMIRRESRGNGLYIHAQIVGHDVSDCFYTQSFYDQCYRLINKCSCL